MSGRLGHKGGATTPEGRENQRKALALGRQRVYLRWAGKLASAESVKQALSENVGAYLERLDRLARESDDERIALDAGRYLIDRVAGKPTEKHQLEPLPVTYQAPSDSQFRELAERIRGDGAEGPNGENGAEAEVPPSEEAR